MQNNPVGWFEIYVNDMQRAVGFYESVLQIKLEAIGDPTDSNVQMSVFPADHDNYGASGALVFANEVTAGQNSILVYFSCSDCAEEESRVVDNGGQVVRSKMAIGEYGHVSLVKDTEGNMIGLHSQ